MIAVTADTTGRFSLEGGQVNANETLVDPDGLYDSTGVCLCPAYARVPGRRELHDIGAPGCAHGPADWSDSDGE